MYATSSISLVDISLISRCKGVNIMFFLAPIASAVEAAFASEAACMFVGGAATAASVMASRRQD